MRILSWFIQVDPKCNHKCAYKREAEEVLTTEKENLIAWQKQREI